MKKELEFTPTEEQKQILLGSMCGDGYIAKRDYSYNFEEGHSLEQQAYLKWKASRFPKDMVRGVNIRKNNIKLRLRSHPLFKEYHNLFYKGGTSKLIVKEALEQLTDLGVTVWFMDDGSGAGQGKHGNGWVHFAYNPHQKDASKIILEFFQKRYNVLGKDTGKEIRFSVEDSVKLCRIFLQHIHPSMYYKIGNLLKAYLPDLHKEALDFLKLPIGRVGVEGVKFPLTVVTKDNSSFKAIASFDLFADLVGCEKGINMSRLCESLMENWVDKPISGRDFKKLLRTLTYKMVSSDAYVSASFSLPLRRQSPATQKDQYMCYDCKLIGITRGTKHQLLLEVTVPVATYCPCSKRMSLLNEPGSRAESGFGAHAQRCNVTLQIRIDNPERHFIWLEDLIDIIESSGSSPLYTLLKRLDEQYVTTKGYAHPKFTEDVAREVASKAMELKGVSFVKVKTAAQESLHPYQAVAVLSMQKDSNGNWVPFHHVKF